MRLALRLLLGALLLLLFADAALLVSSRKLLVHSYEAQMVTREGDVILPASPERRGPGYSAPYAITTCVYWTGLTLSRMPLIGAAGCAWLA